MYKNDFSNALSDAIANKDEVVSISIKTAKAIEKGFKATPKLIKKTVREDFIALIDSCVEGYTGDWDTTGEGRDGFNAMYDLLKKLADSFGVDVSKAKEI